MKEMLKIWRSPRSAFGKFSRDYNPAGEETWNVNTAYTDEELQSIADSGFNAVWVHALLHNIVQVPEFPELGQDAAENQRRLNQLIEHAAAHGLKVFLYMQPPRALPEDHPVFLNHPEIRGQYEELTSDSRGKLRVCAMCTSTESVKKYLFDAAAELARKLPGLGGVIMITASEYPAHCWSRRGKIYQGKGEPVSCPLCKDRRPAEVVNEVIQLMRDGIRQESQSYKIIAWNWSWKMYEEPPCWNIISNLPKDVILLVDFERGGKRTILGKERSMDEYSLGYAGPSQQFSESWELATNSGLEVMAKLQIGTTHEMATVANLPIIGNVYRKAVNVRKMDLAGFMGTWNFGNMITANTAALNYFLGNNVSSDQEQALKDFAGEYFPGANTAHVAAAWGKFAEAMGFYPFSIPFIYMGPVNYACILPMAPAPLTGKSTGRSWLDDERGDDMSDSLGEYTIDEVITGFGRISELWPLGVELLVSGLENSPSLHADEEINNARVCGHLFTSALHFSQVFKLRKNWHAQHLPQYREIIKAEVANLKNLLSLVERDSRMGFHIEAHAYQFDAPRIAKQIEILESQL